MITACLVLAMSTALSAQTMTSLQDIFQRLVQHVGTSEQPKFEDIQNVEEQIDRMSPADIRLALPSVKVALEYRNEQVQAEAASAFFAISLRPDSAELLKPYIADLGKLFNSPSARVTSYAALIFVNLRPAPPPEVLTPMLASISRTSSAAQGQISAITALVRIAPKNPEVIEAIVNFMSRPLDHSTRIAALNAIHTSRVDDPRVQDAIIGALKDPYPGVKLAAIGTLKRMGPNAVSRAKSPLQKIAQEPNEPAQVRAAAQLALMGIDELPSDVPSPAR